MRMKMTASDTALAGKIPVGSPCTIDGCAKPVLARGRCTACYKRWVKAGGVTRPRLKHGEANKTPEHIAWHNALARSEMCDRWSSSYETFLLDMGRRPSECRCLARKDPDLPHSPENSFWSFRKKVGLRSRLQQSSTKKPRVVVDGVTLYRCGGRCERFLSSDNFHKPSKNNKGILGFRALCKQCHTEVALRTASPSRRREAKVRSEMKRRAQKLGVRPDVLRNELALLTSLWGSVCVNAMCGSSVKLTWDHIVPLSCGGAHCVTNLQRLCGSCNFRKRVNTIDYRSSEQVKWADRIVQLREVA